MFVTASFAQAIDTAAYLVPQGAISRDPKGNASLWVVGPGNTAVQRTVVPIAPMVPMGRDPGPRRRRKGHHAGHRQAEGGRQNRRSWRVLLSEPGRPAARFRQVDKPPCRVFSSIARSSPGYRHHHHADGHWRDHEAADRSISRRRTAAGQYPRDLPGSLGPDFAGQRNPGPGAASSPAWTMIYFQSSSSSRPGDDHRHLRKGHRSDIAQVQVQNVVQGHCRACRSRFSSRASGSPNRPTTSC